MAGSSEVTLQFLRIGSFNSTRFNNYNETLSMQQRQTYITIAVGNFCIHMILPRYQRQTFVH